MWVHVRGVCKGTEHVIRKTQDPQILQERVDAACPLVPSHVFRTAAGAPAGYHAGCPVLGRRP